jgi:hypothetical protein
MHKQHGAAEKAAQLALKYRSEQQKQDGVVLVWAGAVYGWKNTLRDPQHERPGAFAVDPVGRVWLAIGGCDQDGARSWEPVVA